jgi:hypothetical protein
MLIEMCNGSFRPRNPIWLIQFAYLCDKSALRPKWSTILGGLFNFVVMSVEHLPVASTGKKKEGGRWEDGLEDNLNKPQFYGDVDSVPWHENFPKSADLSYFGQASVSSLNLVEKRKIFANCFRCLGREWVLILEEF